MPESVQRYPLDLSPKDVEHVVEELTFDKAALRFGGVNRLDDRSKLALAIHVLRRTIAGETQYEVAADLDISQPTVHRLRMLALDTIELPSQEQARRDLVNKCNDELAFYRKRRLSETDTSATDRMILHWEDMLAKATGAYSPVEVSQTVTVETQAERELRELLEQADREEAARVAALSETEA